ncbi:NADPH-dependent FMN reductase [Ekhidna sp.]|uniref:NADPH-dependent FMN reductase n=1 Tax=Ekhidna sp. TaxID=2608089 RepID=UPI003B510A38
MKQIVAFAGSSSKQSINKQLATFTAQALKNVKVNILDLNDFEVPLFSVDLEQSSGIPDMAHAFKKHLDEADAIVLSLAEHNGSFAAAYKNLYDWVSRIDKSVFQHKPLFLLATSPGGRGAKTVLEHAITIYGHANKAPLVTFSLPSFHQNFDPEKGIRDEELRSAYEECVKKFSQHL